MKNIARANLREGGSHEKCVMPGGKPYTIWIKLWVTLRARTQYFFVELWLGKFSLATFQRRQRYYSILGRYYNSVSILRKKEKWLIVVTWDTQEDVMNFSVYGEIKFEGHSEDQKLFAVGDNKGFSSMPQTNFWQMGVILGPGGPCLQSIFMLSWCLTIWRCDPFLGSSSERDGCRFHRVFEESLFMQFVRRDSRTGCVYIHWLKTMRRYPGEWDLRRVASCYFR